MDSQKVSFLRSQSNVHSFNVNIERRVNLYHENIHQHFFKIIFNLRKMFFRKKYFQSITIKKSWSIVNSPVDNTDENIVSSTSNSFLSRFKKQDYVSREFKKGVSQVSFWGSAGHRPPPGVFSDEQINTAIANPASINNLIQTANDNVDIAGTSAFGSANGYIFPRPAKIKQGFKTFGIKLGRFGHLYGTGAFYSHHEYPHEIR